MQGSIVLNTAVTVGPGTTAGCGLLTVNSPAIATTPTDAILLQNATAATSGTTVQQSGNLHFSGTAWNTTATAASNVVDFTIANVPVSGSTVSGNLVIQSKVTGGSYVNVAQFNSSGTTTLTNVIGYRPINAQTGTSYTPVLGDAGYLITLNNASAVTLTIPTNASVAFAIGTEINFLQLGAGQVLFSPASGVTMNSYTSLVHLAGQYASGTLKLLATNTWILVGQLA
jgi:hypothetical protein